jgi:hypothetical protein
MPCFLHYQKWNASSKPGRRGGFAFWYALRLNRSAVKEVSPDMTGEQGISFGVRLRRLRETAGVTQEP